MHLDEKDQINYLANAIFVAGSDGALSPKEAAALDEVRVGIGAKKAIFNSAMRYARSGTYALAMIGGFAEQVKNLADMLYVSIIDGELTEPEKEIISEFSKTINLTEEQLRALSKEVLERIKRKQLSFACPSCKAEIVGASNYCPKCGAALSSQSAEAEFQVPTAGYAIEFCESTSAGFPDALKVARKAPTFTSIIQNKKTWYLAAWPDTEFEKIIALAELLSGVRNKKCYYNGVELQWDELFGFVWCAGERAKAYRPIEYCFGKDTNQLNPWGCRQARMDWTEWARWFSYGSFERSGIFKGRGVIWVFDKARIEHEIMTNLHKFRFCPFLRMDFVRAVLDTLPNSVEVSDRGGWKYAQSFDEAPGSIKVEEVRKSDGIEFKNEYFADGVRPHGLGQLEEILKAAFARVGISDIKADALVR